MNKVSYATWLGDDGLKQFVISNKLSLFRNDEGRSWHVFAIDGNVIHETRVFKDNGEEQTDFETNFSLLSGNSKLNPSGVVTRFEERDKTLKMAHGHADVQQDGTATILLKIPGTPGSGDGRWLSSGMAFFDNWVAGDMILGVWFTDEDNLLGNGAGFLVGSYTDDDMDSDMQGWHIPPIGHIEAEAIGGYGFAPAGFYIKIIGKKGGTITTGKLYCNFEWGKVE